MGERKQAVLITGVAGFIGSNLADRLVSSGYSVVGIDNLSAGILEQVPEKVDFRQVDIRDPNLSSHFKGIDIAFHFAAKNCVSECQLYPHETADVNILGTINVFEAALKTGVNRVIFAESSSIYEGTNQLPTPETDFTPQTFYAISKACDHLFSKAYQQFRGLKTVGLRYLNVYGPRQDYRRAVPPVMSAFIIKLLTGQRPLIFGDGSKLRDFVHVDDVNDFHLLAMKSELAVNRVFNLGCGINYSILDIYNLICDILGVAVKPELLPDVPGEAVANLADITAARSVGWEPRTELRKGLEGMITYIRSEIEKGNIEIPKEAGAVPSPQGL